MNRLICFGVLAAFLVLPGCAKPPAAGPLVVTRTVYVPWTFPAELVNVPADPPIAPWTKQSDAAHYIVALKGVADTCRVIHAAAVAAASTPPPAK